MRDTNPLAEHYVLPIEWSLHTRYLIINGDADLCVGPGHALCFAKRLQTAGKRNYELISYPRAGHILHVPYCPLIRVGNLAHLGTVINYGGEMYGHAKAQ